MHKHNQNTANLVGLSDNTESWKAHFGKADMVIEAVFEDIDLKHKVVKEVREATGRERSVRAEKAQYAQRFVASLLYALL